MSEFTTFAKWVQKQDPTTIDWDKAQENFPDYDIGRLRSNMTSGIADPTYIRGGRIPESFATTPESSATTAQSQMAGEPKQTFRTPGETTPPTAEETLKARRDLAIRASGKTDVQRFVNSLALGFAKGMIGEAGVSSELAPYEEIGQAAPKVAGDMAGMLYGYAGLKNIAGSLAIPLLGSAGRGGAIARWGTLGGAGGAVAPAESAKERLMNMGLGATLFAGGEAVSPYAAKLLSKLRSKLTKPVMSAMEKGTRFEKPKTDIYVNPELEKVGIGSIKAKEPRNIIYKYRHGKPQIDINPQYQGIGENGVVPTPDVENSIRKITDALKSAKPVRKEQAGIYKKERAAKFGAARAIQERVKGGGGLIGEETFYKELGSQKGAMTKAEFETLRGRVSQVDINNLMHKIASDPTLTYGETMTARTGFLKLFGEYGGTVPTNKELELLDQIFPSDLMEALLKKRPLFIRAKEAGLQIINAPKTILSSFDMSFGMRQGAFAGWKYRNEWWRAWNEQFAEFGSEKAYQAGRQALTGDPTYKHWRSSGLDITDIGRTMRKREEMFASSWVEKIPGIGHGIRASNRAYTGFANKFRLDIAKSLAGDIEGMGIDVYGDRLMSKKIADFANAASGRGSLGSFENQALLLNAIFYSPRLMSARLKTMNPLFYAKLPKGLRREALSTAFHSAGAATTILTLAKLGGADVEPSPFSADFGKIKIGNTRIDMTAGYGQYLRGFAQVSFGKMKSSTTGREYELGKEYGKPTRLDISLRQIESKEAPLMGLFTSFLRGRNWRGEEFKLSREAFNAVKPIIAQDVYDIYLNDPELLGLGVLTFFGVSTQSYPSKSTTHKGREGREGRLENKGRR